MEFGFSDCYNIWFSQDSAISTFRLMWVYIDCLKQFVFFQIPGTNEASQKFVYKFLLVIDAYITRILLKQRVPVNKKALSWILISYIQNQFFGSVIKYSFCLNYHSKQWRVSGSGQFYNINRQPQYENICMFMFSSNMNHNNNMQNFVFV